MYKTCFPKFFTFISISLFLPAFIATVKLFCETNSLISFRMGCTAFIHKE